MSWNNNKIENDSRIYTNASLQQKNELLQDQLKPESYITVWKRENNWKEAEIKKQNDIISKYKTQLGDKDKERTKLQTTLNEKIKKISDWELVIKNYGNDWYTNNETLKNEIEKHQKEITNLQNKNELLERNWRNAQEDCDKFRAEIRKYKEKARNIKITKEKDIEFKTVPVHNGSEDSSRGKNELENRNDNPLDKSRENGGVNNGDVSRGNIKWPQIPGAHINNNHDTFLTGNEIPILSSENARLKSKIEQIQIENKNWTRDKDQILMQYNKWKTEKEQLTLDMNSKLLRLKEITSANESLEKEWTLSKETNGSNSTQIRKWKDENNLIKEEKYEIEEIIIKQEEKITELNYNYNQWMTWVKKKSIEIKDNKKYIEKLEETIRELNKDFKWYKAKKANSVKTEIVFLKNQITQLQMEKDKKNMETMKSRLINRNLRKAIAKSNSLNNEFDNNNCNYVSPSMIGQYKQASEDRNVNNNISNINSNSNWSTVNRGNSNIKRNRIVTQDVNVKVKVINNARLSSSWPRKMMLRKKVNNRVGNLDNLSINNNNINTNNSNAQMNSNVDYLKLNDFSALQYGGNDINNIRNFNNYKPVAVSQPDFLMEKQEKEKIEEFKSMLDKLVSDMSK